MSRGCWMYALDDCVEMRHDSRCGFLKDERMTSSIHGMPIRICKVFDARIGGHDLILPVSALDHQDVD